MSEPFARAAGSCTPLRGGGAGRLREQGLRRRVDALEFGDGVLAVRQVITNTGKIVGIPRSIPYVVLVVSPWPVTVADVPLGLLPPGTLCRPRPVRMAALADSPMPAGRPPVLWTSTRVS